MNPDRAGVKADATDALLARAQSWLAVARDRASGKRVEVFHRAAMRIRVARAEGGRPTFDAGREEGVALRLRDQDGRREGFAACACGPRGLPLTWLVARAQEATGPSVGPWRNEPARLEDDEPGATLPPPDDLEGWLDRALAALSRCRGAAGKGGSRAATWIEAGLTAETLVNDSGLAATRSRSRVWAVASHATRPLADAPERPHLIAARRWDRLDPERWAAAFDAVPDGARTSSRSAAAPLALDPEAAATLVTALVPVLHGSGAIPRAPVGAGWSVVDDPLHPDALVGGAFDDGGFQSSRRALSDGGRNFAVLEGPGTLRRASYRDRPAPGPSLLIVAEREVDVPEDAWRIRSARVHPAREGRWLVEVEGYGAEGRTIVRGARLLAEPERLAVACVGSFGRARQSGWGVITPGLVLEGLRAEG